MLDSPDSQCMPPRRALSIRQPYAELILRGIKTIEYRSRRTRIIGERFYIYAARPKTQQEKDGVQALNPDPSPGPRISGPSVLIHVYLWLKKA